MHALTARLLALAVMLPLPASVSLAQAPLFEVETAEAKLLRVGEDGGLLVEGTVGTGVIPKEGAGVRMMWYPGKAAFRAGQAVGEWDDARIGTASAAFGETTSASGSHSLAAGHYSHAAGSSAIALGDNVKAEGNYSFAVGRFSTATADQAVALGSGRAEGGFSLAAGAGAASGVFAFAVGNRTTASGSSATALGHETVASGSQSLAAGAFSVASGGQALAAGYQVRAVGNASAAFGTGTAAEGAAAVAMGSQVTAQGDGSFVFGDRSISNVVVAGPNQFVVRAHGGLGFTSGFGTGCDLPAGTGAWQCASSRTVKENFRDLDGEEVLARLNDLRIQRWRYTGTSADHVGPFAEEFAAAFGLGDDPTRISTIDANGIALRAIQALERRTAELKRENDELRRLLEIHRQRHDPQDPRAN